MTKKSKGKPPVKKTKTSFFVKRASVPPPRNLSAYFEGAEVLTYRPVPITDSEDNNAESGRGAPPSASKSKKSKKSKKEKQVKKKSKRRVRNDSDDDDDSITLERKPSPVVAPLPSLTREEFDFFEMVKDGDSDEVAAFLQSAAFKDMDINKLNKTGFTVLHTAVLQQDEDMIRLLLQQPGIRLYDTLLYVIREENLELTKLLLEHYDLSANEEQRQKLLDSALEIAQDPDQQKQLTDMVKKTMTNVTPVVSPISTRSGVKSSINLNMRSHTVGKLETKKFKLKEYRPRSFYEPKTDIPTTSVSQLANPEVPDESDEIPFDSEFSPVLTPLMLAAQTGNYSLIELFYLRNERLETEEFHHDLDCTCDICTKLEGEQDMTRAYQRVLLYKALTNPQYMCFLGRTEHKDPVNYALRKIVKIRELMSVDHAFSRLFVGFEGELEKFATKMMELCRNTTEAEIFLSPKDSNERLPHLYPRLWYTVGQDLKKFVTSPNAQTIVYKVWATDDWPQWDTYTPLQCVQRGAERLILWPLVSIWLFVFGKHAGWLASPVSRFLNYIASSIWFIVLVGIQACYPKQRCNVEWISFYDFLAWIWDGIDDNKCQKRGPPDIGTEFFLVIYVFSFYISIIKRHSVSWFWKMRWNWVDIVDQLLFTATFGCWGYSLYWTTLEENKEILESAERLMWPTDSAENIADCLLSMASLLAWARLLRFIIVVPSCGPIQIGIGHQVTDFLKGLLMVSIVIISFGSGLMGLYMPYQNETGFDPDDGNKKKDQDDSFHSVQNTYKTLFWILHGQGSMDCVTLFPWHAKDPTTGEVVHTHHILNEWTGKLLYFGFHFLGSMMFTSMLAGYFAQTMTQIQENLDVYWKYARTELFLTFIKDTILPPPFNIFPPCPELKNCIKWFTHLGRKEDPKASCSLKQCCFLTDNPKKMKWRKLMKGYRKLILQLIFRYLNAHNEAKGEEQATKDDILEIGEELAEIKAMLKKASEKIESSEEDDDDDHQFPGGGSGAVGSTKSSKTGWTKTKTMVQSSGATFLKSRVQSVDPSGAPSGGISGGAGGAPSGTSGGGASSSPSGGKGGGVGGSPSGASGGGAKVGPGNSSGGKSTPPSTSNDDFKPPVVVQKIVPELDSMRRFSPSKQSPSNLPTSNNNSTPTKSDSKSKRSSRSGGGLESVPVQDACALNTTQNVTITPSKSNKISSGPTLIQSPQVTPKKTGVIDLLTGTTPPSKVSQYSPVSAPPSGSKSMKPFLDSSIEIKPSTGTLANNNQKTAQNACEYVTPRKGSRSGGGLERPAEMGDFSGPGEVDEPYKPPSKSTNNFYSIPEIGATPKKSPIPQDFARTTPNSKANNLNSIPITKEPSFKSIQTLKNAVNDKPCGGLPSGKTNDYSQPRRGSRSGGGLERPAEMGDFSGPGEVDEPYKSPSKSTTKFYSIPDMGVASKKSPGIPDFVSIGPNNNQIGGKPCSTCTVKPSSAGQTKCDTCSVKPSAATFRTPKESAYKGDQLLNEVPRRGSGKLVDVWPTTTTLGGSTRDIPSELGAPAGPMSAVTKMKMEDPKLTEVKFKASNKPQKGVGQNSPSKSPSLVPSPAAKVPTTPAMPPGYFSSDNSGDATDGSSKANDYKNPQSKDKSKPRAF